jgi:pimeloyl-ACP methyl ester carboxylesterase
MMVAIIRTMLVSLTTLGILAIGDWRCAAADKPTGAKTGVIFTVGGVGGFDVLGQSARWAFPRAGLPHEVRDFAWTHGWGQVLKDLQDHRHLMRKANELAEQIKQLKEADGERPVCLVGKSGGTAVVLAAAEQLPADTLQRIVLLSAAVSPDYDLRPALRASAGGIVSFHSPHDRLILGWGTKEFGTADRVYGPSAGLSGFQLPPNNPDDEDCFLYERLVQVPWNPRMIKAGHFGTHLGTSLPAFLRVEVARWLRE